jgi:hypothetical protein
MRKGEPVEDYRGAMGEYRTGAVLVQIYEIDRFKRSAKRVATLDRGLV